MTHIIEKITAIPSRMWINQPSTLQPAHKWHGLNVLAVRETDNPEMARVFFTSGDVISARIPANSLSKGWK